MDLSPNAIERVYLGACLAELDALKPGNVHRFAPGHGMDVAVFERSAAVSAPEIASGGRPVGERVLRAMQATWAEVGMNTNLGILLLCAPLAAAAERAPASGGSGKERLRAGIDAALTDLGAKDAADVFAAIALASPGGLGRRDEHDVRSPPTISLLDAMRIASPRDRVAEEYVSRFAGVFEVGIPEIERASACGEDGMWPAIRCFFAFAAGFPDSHVARKHGDTRAEAFRVQMETARNRLNRLENVASRERMLLALDAELKAEGLNPGTSADLTVASIFAGELARKLEE